MDVKTFISCVRLINVSIVSVDTTPTATIDIILTLSITGTTSASTIIQVLDLYLAYDQRNASRNWNFA
jgi:hypothetical protein